MIKIISFFTLCFFCYSSNAQKVAQNNDDVKWLKYTDSTSNISVEYPENWGIQTKNETRVFVLKSLPENEKDSFYENINFIYKELPKNSNLSNEEIAKSTLSSLMKKYPSFSLNHSQSTNWLNHNAWELDYKIKTNEVEVNLIQKVLLFKDKLYIGTYTAEANKTDIFLNTANHIFDKMVLN